MDEYFNPTKIVFEAGVINTNGEVEPYDGWWLITGPHEGSLRVAFNYMPMDLMKNWMAE